MWPLVVLVIIAVGAASLYIVLPMLSRGTGVCDTLPRSPAPGMAVASNASASVTFAIIEADPNSTLAVQGYPNGPYEGMNGSAYHLTTPWPVMVVHKGQSVTIRVYNCASSESHGFAIAKYFPQGTVVHPGQSVTVGPFTASQTGNFTVYCDIFCAIHPFMQNGRLDVTS